MKFEVLSKTAYEALPEREQIKYELQLEAHKEAEAKRIAKENVEDAIEGLKKELEASYAAKLEGLSEKNKASLDEMAAKLEISADALKAQLQRAKIGEVEDRMKDFSQEIIAKLSTEEGEAMIKSFFKGRKLELQVTEKALLKPTGGVAPQFTSIVGPGHDDFHARDVIPVFPTVSDVIKYVQFTVDPDADGFGYVAEGGVKPDLGYIPAVVEAIVVKIAGLLDVSDEMMDDVVGFRSWIAYELPKAYLDFEDFQIFKGPGTSGTLLGLWEQADVQTLPLGSVTQSSNVIDKILAGITEVRVLKRATSAVFVSPVQYMEIFINKGNTEEYTWPFILDANGTLRVGGIPIYWSNVFEEYEGLVGDFARGAAIFQRRDMVVDYAREHKDNFARNIITIRLEGRIALVIRYPEAFKRLNFAPVS